MKKEKKTKISQISKADLHVHTCFSDGKPTAESLIDYVASKTDLAVIAVTDHNEVKGAYEARKIARQRGYNLEVIIGEEVTAKEGHIIGLFIEEKIRPGMSAKDTIKEIHSQGGIAVAAHPFFQTRLRTPYAEQIDGVGGVTLIKEKFDAVEIVNATPFVTAVREGLRAKYLNRKLLLKAEVGGSDAHIKEAVGNAYTVFEGKTALDVRKSIEGKKTQAHRGKWTGQEFIKYFFFIVPKVGQIFYSCLRRGLSPREPDIIKIPKDFK